jgi:NAD(P)-dependent dehydrogenase (short-subunit alcohol dehydrogenase family)
MSDRFDGKVVLITGGAKGIGRVAAQRFAALGASVILTDIAVAEGDKAQAEIRAEGGSALFLQHAVTRESEWSVILSEIRTTHGRLDVLINNAGIGFTGLVHEMDFGLWRKMMDVNVDGVFLGTKHALPLLRDTGGGSIINVSSVAGLRSTPNFAGYCATKAAVRSFTKSVALECAQMKDGVRVNSIHPGIIDTDIWDTLIGTTEDGSNNAPRAATLGGMTAQAVPFGRPGTIDEIVDGMLFLASDRSSYMTGAELVLDGGLTAG